MLKDRDEFRKGVLCKLSNDNSINFWLENWCANDCPHTLLDKNNNSQIDTQIRVSRFLTPVKIFYVQQLQILVDDECL